MFRNLRSAGIDLPARSVVPGALTRLTSRSRANGTPSVPSRGQARAQRRLHAASGSGIAAAQAFFRRAVASHRHRPPRKVTLDGHVPSHRALRLLRREHPAWRRVRVRSSKYLNSIIEQDHRAIKRRCASMKGFKSFANAAVTIAGVELAHRIHKHQFSLGRGRPHNDRSLRTDWERAVA